MTCVASVTSQCVDEFAVVTRFCVELLLEREATSSFVCKPSENKRGGGNGKRKGERSGPLCGAAFPSIICLVVCQRSCLLPSSGWLCFLPFRKKTTLGCSNRESTTNPKEGTRQTPPTREEGGSTTAQNKKPPQGPPLSLESGAAVPSVVGFVPLLPPPSGRWCHRTPYFFFWRCVSLPRFPKQALLVLWSGVPVSSPSFCGAFPFPTARSYLNNMLTFL